MPKNTKCPAGKITQTAVRFDASEYTVIKRAAAHRGISVNTFISSICFSAAQKVLQAQTADEELRKIVLTE